MSHELTVFENDHSRTIQFRENPLFYTLHQLSSHRDSQISISGVHSDDTTVSKVLDRIHGIDMNSHWTADFDVEGMPFAWRKMLGSAADRNELQRIYIRSTGDPYKRTIYSLAKLKLLGRNSVLIRSGLESRHRSQESRFHE